MIGILGAIVNVAAIIFAVLGFMYSVLVTFVRPLHPRVDEETVRSLEEADWQPPPIIKTLQRGGQRLIFGLGFALLMVIGCSVWFVFPKPWLCMILIIGLVGEIIFLFMISCWVVFKLMRI